MAVKKYASALPGLKLGSPDSRSGALTTELQTIDKFSPLLCRLCSLCIATTLNFKTTGLHNFTYSSKIKVSNRA